MGLKRIEIFAKNLMMLTYGFTKDRPLETKPDQTSVFLGHDPHIPDR
jgi:hypothetical protein